MKTAIIAAVALAATGLARSPACQADPPVFPDISNYTQVNPQDYTIELPNPGRPYSQSQVYFSTPDGIDCTVIGTGARCTGTDLPGLPTAIDDAAGGFDRIGTDTAPRRTDNPIREDPAHPFKILPPFHSITVDGVMCGVDDAGTTACSDPQGQGFVLSPNGSGWLEQV